MYGGQNQNTRKNCTEDGEGSESFTTTRRKESGWTIAGEIIAEREGMSIPDIFEVHGEQYFRDLETNLLIEMQSRKNVVISCGGGTPLRECNVVEMKKNGRVVLLTASPETIFDRVKDSHDRPVIENNKNVPFIADLMEKRRAKYEAAADIVINTDGKSLIEVCEELVQQLLAMDENK